MEDNISPLNWSEVIELPSIVLEDDKEKHIQNGQLLDRKLFNNSKKHIVIIDNQLKAVYEPFNNKYFKPDKVIV